MSPASIMSRMALETQMLLQHKPFACYSVLCSVNGQSFTPQKLQWSAYIHRSHSFLLIARFSDLLSHFKVSSSSWQVNINKVWITISSVLLGFSFIFGKVISELFESIIFLFMVKPYDNGDGIFIDMSSGALHTVSNFPFSAASVGTWAWLVHLWKQRTWLACHYNKIHV